jgi:4-hydroxyphenylpyruvate dioxygenase
MPNPPRRLRKSIATVSLSGTLPDKLEAAAAAGFDGVEIFENDLLTFDGSPTDIRRLCEALGLAIDIYQPFRDFEAMPDSHLQRNLDRAERKFDVMQELGTELVLACSNVQPHAINDDSKASADLALMAERAARRGLRVGYEALAWASHVNTWGHAWKIVRAVDHPALGLIVDSFHTLSLNDDPSGLADVPGPKIFYCQLADAPRMTMDALSWSRHFRNFPLQGDLDVVDFLRALLASGYDGALSLEIFNDEFRAAPARMNARDGLRSLILAESLAQNGAGLPPVPALDGTEFLEFAVDEGTGQELAAFLRSIGFNHAGRHKSKSVDLYRQGSANLVLNREQDSAASEHFQLHGPSVCAMALRVDDAARAVDRARALLYPDWQERVGAGERHIPAVRMPDGMLVYLVQAESRPIWEDDFDLLPQPAETTGIREIDHVVQALPAGRMNSFVLFWRALFGLQPQPNWETPDPFGLVRSRAMLSENRRVRVALNVSESRETSTGRFVSAFAGGVHHVAFSSDDITRTLRVLEARGAPILPLPDNYYDDLAARWGLEDLFLESLRAHSLLYDRIGSGEFRHAYSDEFEGRFFFEVIERLGDYDGFGAANASVRAAAQARRHAMG